MRAIVAGGLVLVAVVLLLSLARGDPSRGVEVKAVVNWGEVLGPAKGTIPKPAEGKVEWPSDLKAAMGRAVRENRPVFVTMRCLPCKQCADFDKDVLEGGAELDPLLKQFVTVRLVTAKDVDLRLLPMGEFQDMDLSWWGWFLSPAGQVYAVFGGRDEVSDTTRISQRALINTMKRVLAYHYDPRRAGWGLDGDAPKLEGAAVTAADLPGYKSWLAHAPKEQREGAGCIHCHQVGEILRQPAVDAKKFDKEKDLEIWPYPENVGIVLDRDDGLLVKKVATGSVAEKAGLKAGDVVGAANGRRVFGQADLRAGLHQAAPGAGSIELVWVRDGKVMSGALAVGEGWKKTVLDWRMSVSQGNIGAGPGFFPLMVSAGERKKLGLTDDQMGVRPFLHENPSDPRKFGLRSEHVIVAVDGKSPNVSGRGFLVWFRQHHEAGDAVTLTVLENGEKKEISYKLVGGE